MDNYKIIEDTEFALFIMDRFTKDARKKLQIKAPWLGKDKGKVFVLDETYPMLVNLYLNTRNSKVDFKFEAEFVEN